LNKDSKFYNFTPAKQHCCCSHIAMKKISILLFVTGLIVTVGLIIYYKSVVNPVDAEPMSINPAGDMISDWPLFIGIILLFVGSVFYYISQYGKKID